MLREVAIKRITDGLGFRTDLATEAALRLQEAQRDMEMGKTLPWFLIEEDAELTLTEGVATVAIEEDFIREVDWQPMRYTDPSDPDFKPKKVGKRTFEDAQEAYGEHSAGAPQVYVLRSLTYQVFPIPDQEYTLIHSFYKKAALLTSNIENVWLKHAPEVLIGNAGVRLAMDLRDVEAVEIFKSMGNSAWQSLFNETIAREEANRRQRVGGGL